MNSVVITGRLTKDPEVRYTAGNNPTAVANMVVAVERKFKKEGQPDADFPRVTVMGKVVENFVSKYLHKGSVVEIAGELRTGSYTNKNNEKVYTTEVFANDIRFGLLNSGNQQGGNQGGYQNAPQGGYQNAPQGGYQQNPQGGYQQNAPQNALPDADVPF